MRISENRLRKLKLRLIEKRFANHKAPCTAIWQQPLQSIFALRSCRAPDFILFDRQGCRLIRHDASSQRRMIMSDNWLNDNREIGGMKFVEGNWQNPEKTCRLWFVYYMNGLKFELGNPAVEGEYFNHPAKERASLLIIIILTLRPRSYWK